MSAYEEKLRQLGRLLRQVADSDEDLGMLAADKLREGVERVAEGRPPNYQDLSRAIEDALKKREEEELRERILQDEAELKEMRERLARVREEIENKTRELEAMLAGMSGDAKRKGPAGRLMDFATRKFQAVRNFLAGKEESFDRKAARLGELAAGIAKADEKTGSVVLDRMIESMQDIVKGKVPDFAGFERDVAAAFRQAGDEAVKQKVEQLRKEIAGLSGFSAALSAQVVEKQSALDRLMVRAGQDAGQKKQAGFFMSRIIPGISGLLADFKERLRSNVGNYQAGQARQRFRDGTFFAEDARFVEDVIKAGKGNRLGVLAESAFTLRAYYPAEEDEKTLRLVLESAAQACGLEVAEADPVIDDFFGKAETFRKANVSTPEKAAAWREAARTANSLAEPDRPMLSFVPEPLRSLEICREAMAARADASNFSPWAFLPEKEKRETLARNFAPALHEEQEAMHGDFRLQRGPESFQSIFARYDMDPEDYRFVSGIQAVAREGGDAYAAIRRNAFILACRYTGTTSFQGVREAVEEAGRRAVLPPSRVREITLEAMRDASFFTFPGALATVEDRERWMKLARFALDQQGSSHSLLRNVAPGLMSPEICEYALEARADAIKFVPRDLLTQEMCDAVMKADPSLARYVPEKFLADADDGNAQGLVPVPA